MSALKLLQCVDEQGGSGTGCSHYITAAACPRKARLQKEIKQASGVASTLRLDAGKVFHKLAEWYHGEIEKSGLNSAIEYDDEAQLHPGMSEGIRLFVAYRERFPVHAWGKVLDVEMQLGGEGTDGHDELLKAALGMEPFTARLDMVVEIKEEHLRGIKARTGLEPEPGVYLVDHKTKGRKDSNMAITHGHSLQCAAYQVAYKAVTGVQPKGMIFNVVVAHKKLVDDSFASFIAEYPNDGVVEGLKQFLVNAKILAETDMPNWAACFGGYGICPHYTSGACDRT